MTNKPCLLPRNYKKDWMLYFSAILTWSLVTYLSLHSLPFNTEYAIRASAFVVFLILFVLNISYFEQTNSIATSRASVALQIILVWLLISFDRYDISPILLVLIATQLAHLFEKKPAFAIMLVMNIGYFVLIQTGNERGFFSVLIFFLLQLFAYSAIDIMIQAQNSREELAEINQELLATRFMLKESSQRKERLRISRDLHDIIGHQLTALSLNLEVSSHKVADEFKPMIKENLKQAKNLLADVRQVVKEMRQEEQFDLVVTIQAMIDQIPNCQLTVKSSPTVNSLSLKQQLIQCLQEGISNALRHGKADQLSLDCSRNGDWLTILLVDNGSLHDDNVQFGSGLKGMQERLSEFNGEVFLHRENSNTQLKLVVEDCYD